MKKTAYMSISQFAKASGIKRANLIFYDQAGLLHPEFRGENNYRFYNSRQLSTAYLISALRSIGFSLHDIQEYASTRTPENMIHLFEDQTHRIQQEIEKLKEIKRLMKFHVKMAEESMHINLNEIQILELKEEAIFLGKLIQDNQSDDDATVDFFNYSIEQGINPNYPSGTIIAKEALSSLSPYQAKQFYMHISHHKSDFIPAGRYVVGYTRGAYGRGQLLLRKLLDFIQENHLIICGDAYEEYPLNEMSIQNTDNYLIKIKIRIE